MAAPADTEQESRRRTVTRAMRTGLWIWPAFTLLDVYMCFVAYPDARFSLFIVYRALVTLLFLFVYRTSQRADANVNRLFEWLNLTFGASAIGISLMAIELGGIRSPYMLGISIVALVRATLVPTHWRHSMVSYGRIGLAFPLVVSVGALLSPTFRAEWFTADALIHFVSNYVFVVASSFLGMVSGHIAWSAQEQLYRARRVGPYRLQAPIGKGGMGDVWLAWDLSLRRNVALKILRGSEAPTPETVKRFEREAQAAGQLRNPHVVQVFDFGASDDGLYYIAMEYLSGMDLGTLVDEFGPLPPARAVDVVMQACSALEDAHAAGIIHRDPKPHNLFMSRVANNPDFVKLLDFGVARLQPTTGAFDNLTWTGVMVGTPSYLARELWLGAQADERSDIYALGATFHYLLSGVVPSARRGRSSIDENDEPRCMRATAHPYTDAAPAGLEMVLERCLAVSPEGRYQTAHELHAALAALHDPTGWTREDAEEFWRAVDRRRFGPRPSRVTHTVSSTSGGITTTR